MKSGRARSWNSTLRQRSPKTEAKYVLRRAFVETLLQRTPACQAGIAGVCTGLSEHIHEPLTRARGGDILDEHNALAVCAYCHSWIHEHPIQATARGLLRGQLHGHEEAAS